MIQSYLWTTFYLLVIVPMWTRTIFCSPDQECVFRALKHMWNKNGPNSIINVAFPLKGRVRMSQLFIIMTYLMHVILSTQQLWQLETLLLQKDTYLNYSQALSYTSQALSQNLHGLRYKGPIKRLSKTLVYFLQENWKRIWVLTLWVLIMIGLFTWKFYQYKHKSAFKVMGYCLLTAKGAGETLKFNMALVLLPVCRNTITWLRSSKMGYFVPFDDNINFHKVIKCLLQSRDTGP